MVILFLSPRVYVLLKTYSNIPDACMSRLGLAR